MQLGLTRNHFKPPPNRLKCGFVAFSIETEDHHVFNMLSWLQKEEGLQSWDHSERHTISQWLHQLGLFAPGLGGGKWPVTWRVMRTTWHSSASRKPERPHFPSENWNGAVGSRPPAPRLSPSPPLAVPVSSPAHHDRSNEVIYLRRFYKGTFKSYVIAQNNQRFLLTEFLTRVL